MKRLRTIKLGILNIKIHPHSCDRYIELFEEVVRLNEPTAVFGSEWGMIGYIGDFKGQADALGQPELKAAVGAFYRFLNIDPKKPWFHLLDRRPLDTEVGDRPPAVPDHLKPNFREVSFVFFPDKHRLFFDVNCCTHNFALRLLEKLFKNDQIVSKWGPVDVIVESSRETLENILNIRRLIKLDIFLTRPNPDDLSVAAREIEARMGNQNIRRWNQTLRSSDEIGLCPDQLTKGAMELAISNGSVSVVGYDGEKKVQESTVDHPHIERDVFDPKIETMTAAIFRMAQRFFETLRVNRK